MEEKLLASLAGRKKANASRLLRRKESGGKRAAATKVDVEIGQGHKDASQKPADDVISEDRVRLLDALGFAWNPIIVK